MDSERAALQSDMPSVRPFRHDYRTVLNGVALTLTQPDLAAVRALPYVASVTEDTQVRTLNDDMNWPNPLVGADRVWNELHATGAGIKIAVVDTGIDYTHADLGSCLGPGCKVIGGWDFVNGDADPMDDYGHGTHVAGIAAAKGSGPGTKTGVAPDAKLLAYKVLNEWGSGSMSDVIAAVDKAVDPDGNPATDDGADVINLSLGGPGDGGDPLSQAVNDAVTAGVVVVAAAGNDGGYFTMGSPALASKAITVGATDRFDAIAGFSSRGPTPNTYDIKPDLVAPGVDVTSTVPTSACPMCDASGYVTASGTSMATPHVAGGAALLLSLHSGWSPATVKSALIGQALRLPDLDAFTQGGGRLQVFDSATAQAVVSAPSFSFGVDDGVDPWFIRNQPFVITNLTGSPIQFSCAVAGFAAAGISTSCSPSPTTVPAGGSTTVTAGITVNNAVTPEGPPPVFHYQGDLVLTSASDAIPAPMALIRSAIIDIRYDVTPWNVVLHNRSDWAAFFGGTSRIVRPVQTGTYDVVTFFPPPWDPELQTYLLSWSFRESIAVTGTTIVSISNAEVNHRQMVTFPVPSQYWNSTQMVSLSYPGLYQSIMTSWGSSGLILSDVSSSYHIDWSLELASTPTEQYLANQAFRDGVTASHTFVHPLGDFTLAQWEYGPVQPGVTRLGILRWLCSAPGPWWMVCGGSSTNTPYATSTVDRTYFIPRPFPDFAVGYEKREVNNYDPPGQLLAETPQWTAVPGAGLQGFIFGDPDQTAARAPLGTISVGLGPLHWAGQLTNWYDTISLRAVIGSFIWLWRGQMAEFVPDPDPPYKLYQDGNLVEEGTLVGAGVPWYSPWSVDIPVAPGAYTLEVRAPTISVGGASGSGVASLTFDTRRVDPNPPYLTSFQVQVNGDPTDILEPTGTREVTADVLDDSGCLSEVKYWYDAGAGWVLLTVTNTGSNYKATLPGLPAGTNLSLRLRATDCAGNVLQQDLVPVALGQGDSDGDGFQRAVEAYVGTDPLDACPDSPTDDAWPPDIDMNTVVDVIDAVAFLAGFPSAEGSPGYSQRLDMAENNGVIDVIDAVAFLIHFPSACTP